MAIVLSDGRMPFLIVTFKLKSGRSNSYHSPSYGTAISILVIVCTKAFNLRIAGFSYLSRLLIQKRFLIDRDI